MVKRNEKLASNNFGAAVQIAGGSSVIVVAEDGARQ
jgi:hypothetical protein